MAPRNVVIVGLSPRHPKGGDAPLSAVEDGEHLFRAAQKKSAPLDARRSPLRAAGTSAPSRVDTVGRPWIRGRVSPPCNQEMKRSSKDSVIVVVSDLSGLCEAAELDHICCFKPAHTHAHTHTNTFNSIQFICIAQFHKLQICLGVLYNLYT